MIRDGLVWVWNWIVSQFQPSRVSLVKRPVEVEWVDAAAADGWEWRNTLMNMRLVDPVSLEKTLEQQEQQRYRRRLRHDDLGSWDPDAVDWSEPSIYREMSLEAFASGMFRSIVRNNGELIDHAMDLVLS